jgi:2-(1,2-epoxy-1,2-dihydrophenyl)acetyl-CoA isomerase
MDFDGRVQRLQRWHRIPQMIRAIPKVFVAAVNGPAAGMGFGLALACDLRIAAASAKFVTSFAKVGFSGDFGGPYFLAQLVGGARARQLYYLSETLSADEALALGLVNWVVSDADFPAELAQLTDRLLQGPTVALGYMKRNFNFAETAGLGEYLDLEAVHQVRTAFTDDHISRVTGR